MNKFNIEMQFGVDKKTVVKRTFKRALTQDLVLAESALYHLIKASHHL